MPIAGAQEASKLAAEELYEYSLRALVKRPHTSAELRAKLSRRAAEEGDVEDVIARLHDHGYLNDEMLAESHSEFRRDYALLGQKRVLAELRRRGVDASTAEKAVEEAYAEADEVGLAREFLRRKLGRDLEAARIDNRRDLQRFYGALARAGFEPPAIADALREISADDELLDALASVEAGD